MFSNGNGAVVMDKDVAARPTAFEPSAQLQGIRASSPLASVPLQRGSATFRPANYRRGSVAKTNPHWRNDALKSPLPIKISRQTIGSHHVSLSAKRSPFPKQGSETTAKSYAGISLWKSPAIPPPTPNDSKLDRKRKASPSTSAEAGSIPLKRTRSFVAFCETDHPTKQQENSPPSSRERCVKGSFGLNGAQTRRDLKQALKEASSFDSDAAVAATTDPIRENPPVQHHPIFDDSPDFERKRKLDVATCDKNVAGRWKKARVDETVVNNQQAEIPSPDPQSTPHQQMFDLDGLEAKPAFEQVSSFDSEAAVTSSEHQGTTKMLVGENVDVGHHVRKSEVRFVVDVASFDDSDVAVPSPGVDETNRGSFIGLGADVTEKLPREDCSTADDSDASKSTDGSVTSISIAHASQSGNTISDSDSVRTKKVDDEARDSISAAIMIGQLFNSLPPGKAPTPKACMELFAELLGLDLNETLGVGDIAGMKLKDMVHLIQARCSELRTG